MDWDLNDGLRALSRMKERASCRAFEDSPIPDDLLRNILETGLRGASGGNAQPFSIVVVRDAEQKEGLYKILGQRFVAKAAANFIFVLDFYKMGVFARYEKAPYTCNDSYMHFLIALEDIMCTAQNIETAMHMCGLGSCYIGSVNQRANEVIKLLELPEKTFPVLLLSAGWPKAPSILSERLPYDMMVFEDKYRAMTDEEIIMGFKKKYAAKKISLPEAQPARDEYLEQYRFALKDLHTEEEIEDLVVEANKKGYIFLERKVPLPKKEPFKSEALSKFRRALSTTYSEAETEEITRAAVESESINELQRMFGLHYHAYDLRKAGEEIIKDLERQKITPFYRTESD